MFGAFFFGCILASLPPRLGTKQIAIGRVVSSQLFFERSADPRVCQCLVCPAGKTPSTDCPPSYSSAQPKQEWIKVRPTLKPVLDRHKCASQSSMNVSHAARQPLQVFHLLSILYPLILTRSIPIIPTNNYNNDNNDDHYK